jgi:hypothetical protein
VTPDIDESNVDKDIDVSTENTMRERSGESRLKLWMLLKANRLVVTGTLAVVFFVVFVIGVSVLPPPLVPQLNSSDTIDTIFTGMIGAIITGVTIVVTISQLVLSQENGPLGDQRSRMEDSMDFRDFTAELTGAPSPADPSAFLREIIDVCQDRAEAVRDGFGDIESDQLRWEVDQFTQSLIGNSEEVRDQLDGATFGDFDVTFAALNFNYGWKIFQIERLLNDHEEDLGQPENDLLDELKTALSMFGPAREHVKTLYFEWALTSLSQLIIYVSIPSLAVASIMTVIGEAGTFPGSTLGIENIALLIGASLTVTILPFFLLVSYISRVVTLAKRTLAIEPLILRESQR